MSIESWVQFEDLMEDESRIKMMPGFGFEQLESWNCDFHCGGEFCGRAGGEKGEELR